MKFSQMKYERPDAEQLKAELNGLTEKLKVAKSYAEAKELFLAEEKLNKHTIIFFIYFFLATSTMSMNLLMIYS